MIHLFNWVDAAWIPLLLFAVHKDQRLCALGFAVSCMIMMRMLVELMGFIGHPRGLLPLLETPLFERGLWTYSFVYVIYGALLYMFPGTRGVFLIASSISMFFFAAILFTGIMVL